MHYVVWTHYTIEATHTEMTERIEMKRKATEDLSSPSWATPVAEILVKIFAYLHPKDLSVCSLVSSEWNTIGSSSIFLINSDSAR